MHSGLELRKADRGKGWGVDIISHLRRRFDLPVLGPSKLDQDSIEHNYKSIERYISGSISVSRNGFAKLLEFQKNAT